MKMPSLFAAGLLLLTLTSCAVLEDPESARQEHIGVMQAENDRLASELTASPLTLDECIRAAMRNNYSLRLAALRQRMSEVDVKQAFSAFLAWRHQQTMGGNATAEQNYLKSGVDLQMPLFVPSAWMLYANRKLGMEQAALAAHIARQSVEYNVTVLYYNVLVCEDAVATLKSQVESAASRSRYPIRKKTQKGPQPRYLNRSPVQ